ncbi:MAG TPA: glutamyl-tRNA reductase [Chitinophagaceae bacterium]|nr:glutamyl-tRNA reductase [Chitinophagaceae bacterium]
MINKQEDISNFFVAGINYKKTDATVRGLYAINADQYRSVLHVAPEYGISELFVLSTCNRTEIYGFAENASLLCELLCTQTKGTLSSFREIAYIKQGSNAIEHLFNVAAGLDSQILGDYEIVGQIKQAVKFSKENNCIGAYLERMINAVLQSSKEIKTTTGLSGGTVSVSFAAVQYIKEKIAGIADKKILLLGTGKIGRNTCKNLVDYLGTKNITLINRTEEKAATLAGELGLRFAFVSELTEQVNNADIILVATNSVEPVILESHVEGQQQKLIIDLSVPCNVEETAQRLPNVTLVNVDELSKIKDETLQKREAEVPKAKAIIAKHMDEFIEWHEMRRHVPVLKAVKTKLEQIHNCNLYISYSSRNASNPVQKDKVRIQKVINGMAVKMREQNQQGCYYIEAINEYMATGTN